MPSTVLHRGQLNAAFRPALHVPGGKGEDVDVVNVAEAGGDEDVAVVLAELETEMLEAAGNLEFERAAVLRDQIDALKSGEAKGGFSKKRRKSSSRGKRSSRKR